MQRKRRSSHLDVIEEPQINMTPLIDVVFVLLISFIIIAPILEMDRISLASSTNEGEHLPTPFQEVSPIQIKVQENNSIYFNTQKVTLQELPTLLKDAKRKYPKARPQLLHDKKAYFGTYQSVKNILENLGFQELDVVLAPG